MVFVNVIDIATPSVSATASVTVTVTVKIEQRPVSGESKTDFQFLCQIKVKVIPCHKTCVELLHVGKDK